MTDAPKALFVPDFIWQLVPPFRNQRFETDFVEANQPASTGIRYCAVWIVTPRPLRGGAIIKGKIIVPGAGAEKMASGSGPAAENPLPNTMFT
ncbi:MAG: hypothetical protein ACLQIQ_11615 [Beijerinckiaceae bacterium]